MFDSIDSPVAYTNGWNRGFEDGVDFIINHLTSDEFNALLKEKNIDTNVVVTIALLLRDEE
jgi:hypothetical protein